MSGLVVTIAGTDVTAMIAEADGNPEIDVQANARGVMRATLRDRTGGSYRPALGATIAATLDGTAVFGGIVQTVDESEQASGALRVIEVTTTDFTFLLDIGVINGILGTTGSTLRDIVDAIISVIGNGVTRDPSMVAGPVINAQGFPFRTFRQAFNDLSQLTQYAWRMDGPTKVVYWKLPAAMDAPFGIDASVVFDNQLTRRLDLGQYANNVWLQFGANGPRDVTRTMHGDGSTHLFPLTGQPFGRGYNLVSPPPTVTVNGVVFPVGIWGVDTGLHWYYRESDPTYPFSLIHELTDPALGPGDTIVATFTAQFPGVVYEEDSAEIAARGGYSIVQVDENVYDVDVAIAEAQGIVRRRTALPKQVTALINRPGLQPLMSTTVTWPRLGLSGDFMVTGVRMRRVTAASGPVGGEFWKFQIDLIEGNEFKGNWIDYFLQLEGQAGSGSGGVGAIVTGGVTPTAIVYANWGGSRQVGVSSTTSWTDVREWRDIVLAADARVNVRVDRRTQHSSVSVKARVYDYTAGSAPVTGVSTTSTTWAEEILSFDGQANHRYRLQVQPGINSDDYEVYAVGVGA